MRTTLNIDEEILKFVLKETGARTKSQAVRQALQDYIYQKKVEKLIALKGLMKFDRDGKTLRKGWDRSSRAWRRPARGSR